ncbi:hypothetical protein [Actomonas aquatica]|uniref:BIG2 domain-containing protein n=1 Tax=Actomonas aquatica TaxID=2866162 RepID=A0ABZ1CBM1_9BACT|nr:hypothetical protein [Opitutus sp. WL0086]WRQ88717.1 hypothetical protein K1X11_004825 [Opitutus sp. WL0086]
MVLSSLFPQRVRCLAAWILSGIAVVAQELSIDFESVSTAELQVRVTGPDGEPVVIEVSDDLIHWAELERGTLAGGAHAATDDGLGVSGARQRFYRARILGEDELFELLQEDQRVLAGDTLILRLQGGAGGNWAWSVDGVEGGNGTVGTIRVSLTDSAVAYYTAPTGTTGLNVTLRATDLDDASRVADTGVTVEALPGELVIVPGDSIIGVGETVQFQAGIHIVDFGFLPLRNAVWKLNNYVGGLPGLGALSLDGTYTAPPVLPDALPVDIVVGYSLGAEQAPLQTAAITLVDVEISPGEVVRFDETEWDTEPQTQFVATRHFSDGTTGTPGAAAFSWTSNPEERVTVDDTGLMTVWEEPGLAVVTAQDLTYQVVGRATVKAREPVYFWAVEAQVLGDVSYAGGYNQIEVTQPDVTFALDPRLRITRVPFYSIYGPEPEHISGRDIAAITYSATGDVVDYNQFDRIVQNTGIAARIEEKSGVLEIGDTAGQGVVTVSYDDGEYQNSTTVNVRYTQLDMNVSVMGSQTEATDEVYITEWIDFDVQLSNPFEGDYENGASVFVGKMEVKVEVVEGDEFWVVYDRYLRDGELPPTNGTAVTDVMVEKTAEFRGFVAESNLPDTGGFGVTVHPNHGRARFSVSPTRAGEMTFRVSVVNDPNIPAQTFTLNVIQPELQMVELVGRPVPPDNQLPVRHFLPLQLVEGQPNLRSMQFNGTSWADLYPEEWVIERPAVQPEEGVTDAGSSAAGGGTLHVPVSEVPNFYDFKEFFDAPGTYTVRRALAGRPEISTAPFTFSVPSLDELTWPTKGDNPWHDSGEQVPDNMMLGGIEVLWPKRGVWIPGKSIRVVMQHYNAAGEAMAVGQTFQESYVGGYAERVEAPSTTLLYARPRRLIGPGVTFDYDQFDTGQGYEDNLYVDATGQQAFTINVLENSNYTAEQQRYDLLIGFDLTPVQRDYYTPFEGDRFFSYTYTFNGSGYPLTEQPAIAPPTIAAANYADPAWSALHNFVIRIGGHGVVFTPDRLPIPSERVRQAVADGDLPAEAAQVRVTLEGTEGFAEALAAGFDGTLDLGDGLSLASHEIDGDALRLVIDVDATYWGSATTNDYDVREVELVLGDGSTWPGEFQLFGAALTPKNPNGEVDVALNASYGLAAPRGSVEFGFERRGLTLPPLTATLRPSIHAVWDANQDGVADPEEDTNNDGRFDEADVAAGAAGFRGQFATSPLLGFSRQTDPLTGEAVVRDLAREFTIGTWTGLRIYGNTTDRRTVSRSRQLGELGLPDGLPDFLSSGQGAEAVEITASGNYVDYQRFTAYNFTTEFVPAEEEPVIGFDDVKADLHETYRRYSQFDLPLNLADVAGNPKVTRSVSVWVDHEATDFDHFRAETPEGEEPTTSFENILYGQWPSQYYGGVLDQYFQMEVYQGTVFDLGKDGRVREYTPLDPPGTPTGTTRHHFGVALDGVLYDAHHGSVPKPRLRDAFYAAIPVVGAEASAIYGAAALASNRFDYVPNSSDLLGLDIVTDLTAETGSLNDLELLPRLGAVSGGFVDVRTDDAPTFAIEATLPGAQLPGLHAGYLIKGQADQIRDPFSEAIEDDLEQVSLTRLGAVGAAAGTKPQFEEVFLGSTQPRPVMIYGSDVDKKAPVETGVRISASFAIGVDPLDYAPANPDTWKIKAGLNLTERQALGDPAVDLLVTTQSEGDEEATKIVADAVVDLTVDIIANAVLSTVTSGGYLAACQPGVDVTTAAINLGVGLGENAVLDVAPGKKGPIAMVLNGTLNGTETSVPGFSLTSAKGALEGLRATPDTETGLKRFTSQSYRVSQPLSFNHCDLLQQPFNLLKDRIKSTYTARTFGGLGASEAVGVKVLAICIPVDAQLDNGVFSAYTSFSRRAFIQPKEQATKPLSELPWQSIWESYPYPDEVSDEELLTTLMALADDPAVGEDALAILRAAGAYSLQRETDRTLIEDIGTTNPAYVTAKLQETRYQSYKLRTFPMHEISLYVGPGYTVDANGESAFGDFVLTPGETQIPVSYGAVATATRTNENANARALFRHHGIDLQMLGIVIQDPADLPTPAPEPEE